VRRAVLSLAIAWLLAIPVRGQKYDKLMEAGEGADLRGKTIKAAEKFEAAAKAATTPEERVQAWLSFTDAIRGAQSNAALDQKLADEVQQAYTTVLTEATGPPSFKAHNDYGVFLLDRGDVTKAIQIFADGEKNLGSVGDVTAARYLHNAGIAYGRDNKLEEALRSYRRAIEKDSIALSADNAFITLSKFEAPRATREAVSLIDLLLEKDRVGQAAKYIRATLESEGWRNQNADLERVVGQFARMAVAAEADHKGIVTHWVPRLKELEDKFDGDTEEKIEQLLLVYEGSDLPMSFDANIEHHFSRWNTPQERSDLSRLLQKSADAAVLASEPKRASERYIAAWKLDPKNLDALTYLANLLMSWKSDDSERLLNRLTAQLFDAKGSGLASGDDAAQLRLHMVLGSIFEAKGVWGPAEIPATATYHYAAALDAYERLRNSPDTPLYPGLHANLAAAYERTGNVRGAWQQYIASAEANLKSGELEAASAMLARSQLVAYEETDEERNRLEQLRAEVAAKRDPAPVTDAAISEAVQQRIAANPDTEATKLDVTVQNGVVVVTGEVPDQRVVEGVTAVVQNAVGVKEVKVEVEPAPPPL
jgi:tetratricopeptide (TPR) repeat protein